MNPILRFSARSGRWFAAAAMFLSLLISFLNAQTSQATGLITGRVSNAGTGASLEGAVVRVAGTSLSTITERDGTYRLQVPAGDYTVATSYTGLDDESLALSIQAGATVRQDVSLTSQVYKLEKFVVAGDREGNALAITMQRQLPNIKNVVSADAFGSLAGNPADLLIKVPGVEGVSSGGDNRYLRIRGINYNLSTVTMDGNRVADAASAGNTREVQFQTIGSDAIERMEVVKTPPGPNPMKIQFPSSRSCSNDVSTSKSTITSTMKIVAAWNETDRY